MEVIFEKVYSLLSDTNKIKELYDFGKNLYSFRECEEEECGLARFSIEVHQIINEKLDPEYFKFKFTNVCGNNFLSNANKM